MSSISVGDHSSCQPKMPLNVGHGSGKGLGWPMTALFLVADMLGGGIVALPMAVLNTGLFVGTLSMLVVCAAFCYTGHLLGQNWLTMCRRWPEIYGQIHCRKPFPEMAYRAMGERARFFMSCTLNTLLFAVCVVYLLLGSTILAEFWASLNTAIPCGKCIMIVIMAAALLPITLLKSPQDFWWAVVCAMMTSSISVVLILLGSILDLPICADSAQQPPFRPANFFLSIGVFFFAFGGHGVFPTIQHDMRDPSKFTHSVIVTYIGIFCMYVPLCYFGYFVYGDSLQPSIISSIQTGIIQQLCNLLIAFHCILTVILIINPLNQEVEHLLNTKQNFCWQRVLIRSMMMAAVAFIALSVPNFGPILDLIGGAGVTLISAVLPCTFYLYLHANQEVDIGHCNKNVKFAVSSSIENAPSFRDVLRRTPSRILALNVAVIAVGIVCGISATYTAILELTDSKFGGPCYWPASSHASSAGNGTTVHSLEAMHCCGTFRNITRWKEFICPAYNISN